MSLINLVIILSLILLTGFHIGRNQDRLIFMKAFLVACFLTVTSALAVLLATVVTIEVLVGFLAETSGTFSMLIIVMIIAGNLNFAPAVWILKHSREADNMAVMVEYYIQWTTIFFTLYQVMVGTKDMRSVLGELNLTISGVDINALNLQMLPILLVTWISIVMAKIYMQHE